MVYLINSNYSETQPVSWLCGGALVSPNHVLTAAACLMEVSHIYVIAGYKKYVSAENINDDECTRNKKGRIITTIVPKEFNLTKWIKFDVGIGVVEKPFDFYDISYNVMCSYVPGSISINFESNYERDNLHTIVYGWGGNQAREEGKVLDINSRFLQEARTVLTNSTFCLSYMDQPMENYFLCAYGTGYIASDGKDVSPLVLFDNCATRRFNLEEDVTNECIEDADLLGTRRSENRTGTNTIEEEITKNKKKTDFNYTNTRRQLFQKEPSSGICQNDHGGPLVTWIGKTEIIIGIAINSFYSSDYECNGPFLYLSTAKSKDLVNCLLNGENEEKRKACEAKNYKTEITAIQWPDLIMTPLKVIKRRQQFSQHPQYLIRLRPQAKIEDIN